MSAFRSDRRRRLALACVAFLAVVLTAGKPEAGEVLRNNSTSIAAGPGPGPASPYPTGISFSGVAGRIVKVALDLQNVSHTFPDDLDIVLVSPNGQAFLVMSDVGGSAVMSNATITIDDEAPTLLPDQGVIATGSYRPTNYGAGDSFPAPGPGTAYISPAPVSTGTLNTAFRDSNPNGTWNLYVFDDATNDSGALAGGWSLYLTLTETDDFDGTGTTDYTVVRGAAGAWTWYTTNAAGFSAVPWGSVSQHQWLLSGDYDGDGKSDRTVWGGSPPTFYVLQSSNGSMLAQPWGLATDFPLVPGDYDVDGKTDFAVWRPSTGVWYVLWSSNGSVQAVQFGQNGDSPLTGDYDGDRLADLTVRRPASGVSTFYTYGQTDGFVAVQWGLDTDTAVPGDYDGDGKTDIAVVRTSGGVRTFYVRRSSNGGLIAQVWGLAGDVPVPGNYDGDLKTDFAVWRIGASSTFYVMRSIDGGLIARPFGQIGDYPLAIFRAQ